MTAMESDPRPLDELDSLLGADAEAAAAHALGHFEPYLPMDAAEAAFEALVARYRLRWSEYWGPVGERIRTLEADGLIRVDRARGRHRRRRVESAAAEPATAMS